MANFWTADLHFNHLRANELCRRPFKDVEEMNETLITNFNKILKKEDTLWVIGDFCMGKDAAINALEFRQRLNAGIVNLITGNHDYKGHREYKTIKYFPETFDAVYEYGKYIKIASVGIFMSHWAGRTWPEQGHQSWNLYGHSHASLPDDQNALAIDVGVDCFQDGIHERFFPYSLKEIEKIMKLKTYVKIDHH